MPELLTHHRQSAVLLLLAIAGSVDAIGLAELGRYFTSFMSGNTTLAGLAMAYGDRPGFALPLGLVALFVAGATIGALVMEKARGAGPGLLLLATGAVMAIACVAFAGPRPMAGVALLPIAMGMVNLVTLRDGSVSIGVTYASGTLVRIGVGLARLGRGGDGRLLAYDIAIWLALLIGAMVGGFGRLRYGTGVLIAPALLLLVLGIADLAMTRRERRVIHPGSGR